LIYCTDMAKVTAAPVLHINADDVEAVVHAAMFALEYRMQFGKDVFIELLGYRKYGHNEGDEPRFTQPTLYKAIGKHPNVREIYFEKLKKAGIVDDKFLKKLEDEYKNELEEDLKSSKEMETTVITPIMQDTWQDYEIALIDKMNEKVDTKVDMELLTDVAKKISELPSDKKFFRKTQKLIEDRRKMFFDTNKLDWSMAEHLA